MQPRFSCDNMSSCKSGLTVNVVEIQSAYRDRISSSMKRTDPFHIFPPRTQSTGSIKTRIFALFSLMSNLRVLLLTSLNEIKLTFLGFFFPLFLEKTLFNIVV